MHPRCSVRLAARSRSAANTYIRGTVGRFAEPPFSEPPSAAAAAAVNRRHEHSATAAAERFRSERHRSDGGTRAWPKVPPAVGDWAGYPRETGRRNRKRSERKKRGEGGKIKDTRERNHAGPAYSRDCTGCLRLVAALAQSPRLKKTRNAEGERVRG